MGVSLHSGPAPTSSQMFLPKEEVISLSWCKRGWHDYEASHIPPQKPASSPAISCVILPFRLFVCFILFLFFLLATRRRVEMWRGRALHLCLPSEACWCRVLDDNRHRPKCLTYHDVCSMMGDHMQFGCCYMMKCVCVCVRVLRAFKLLLKPPLFW